MYLLWVTKMFEFNISKPKHPALLKFCTQNVLGFIPNLRSWQPKKIEKNVFFLKLEKHYTGVYYKGVRAAAAGAAMAAPLFGLPKIFSSISAVGAARLSVNSRLLTDRDSSVTIRRGCTNTAQFRRTLYVPRPILIPINHSDTGRIVLLSLDGTFCAYLGPLLLQSLSSRVKPPARTHPPLGSLHRLYQHDHNHWLLHFKLPSDALVLWVMVLHVYMYMSHH